MSGLNNVYEQLALAARRRRAGEGHPDRGAHAELVEETAQIAVLSTLCRNAGLYDAQD